MKKTTNTKYYFLNGDPFTYLLRVRLHLKPLLITMIVVPLLNVPILISTYLNNAWFSTRFVGLFQDYTWWILQVTTITFTIYYFFWLPDGYQNIIHGLVNNKTVKIINRKKNNEIDRFLNDFDNLYSKKIWAVISLFFTIIFWVFVAIPEQTTFKLWETTGNFVLWYTIVFWGLFFFLITLGAFRILLIIYSLNLFFKKFKIFIKVLHPDGAGGLSPLGEFSIKLAYLIAALGIATVSLNISNSYILNANYSGFQITPYAIFLLFVYLLSAPIIFFAPIGTARAVMLTAKQDFIIKIADQFDFEINKIMVRLSDKPDELKNAFEKTEQLQKIYNIARSFPVWPFNSENILRFFSVISSPIVLAIMSIVIDIII